MHEILCILFEEAYQSNNNDPEVEFSFESKDGQRQRTWFVVRSEGSDLMGSFVKFHISPGH